MEACSIFCVTKTKCGLSSLSSVWYIKRETAHKCCFHVWSGTPTWSN